MSLLRSEERQAGDESVVRNRLVAVGLLVLVVLLPVLFLFVGPVTLKAYDAAHQEQVACDVVGAAGRTASSYSPRGVGSSNQQIYIETTDCGLLVLRWGVTRDNIERLTSDLDRGGPTRFTVGAASYELRDTLKLVNQAVFVRDPERLSQSSAS
ncbi:hypothetical protein [Curtobacterium sp. AG1037]|uniref:hypothetical protein n=1 Tax=Curtobacterium sp. AG1037 TaxID=2183990 RepID=UPI0011C053F8|nr:hypothetical protein [Curtobacterium sp. AG1037]